MKKIFFINKFKLNNLSLGKKILLRFHNYSFSSKINEIPSNVQNSGIEQVKHMTEFQSGINLLNEGKFENAEYHLRECLKILKSIHQTETIAYIFILKKYTQILFYLKRIPECEKYLNASVEISKKIFNNSPELCFPYIRNLLAFYTHTDITKASDYVDTLLSEVGKNVKPLKFYTFAGGAIKLLNNDFSSAKQLMNKTMEYQDLPSEIQGLNLHNLGLLNLEIKRVYESFQDEAEKKKWVNQNKLIGIKFNEIEKESFLLYKQCLSKLEIPNDDDDNDSLSTRKNSDEIKLLSNFLLSENEILPEIDRKVDEEKENMLISCFKNKKSGLSMTNIAEMFFEKGKDKERQTAFWLKAGIKHYEKYEKENIARHLIVFALFYSQLGQTMIAEGLYRRAIDLLKNVCQLYYILTILSYFRIYLEE
jgi:hypothetical protein